MNCFGLFCTLLLVSAACASSSDDSKSESNPTPACFYFVDDLGFDLSSAKGQVFTFTNENKSLWTWSFCGPLNGTTCAANSSMCVIDETGKVMSFGTSIAAVQPAEVEEEGKHDDDDDDDDDEEESLTLKYTGGDQCANGQRTATVVLICDEDVDLSVQTAELNDCETKVTVSSRFGCAVEEDDDDDNEGIIVLLLSIMVPVGVLASIATCISCLYFKRKIFQMRANVFRRLSEEPFIEQQPMPIAPQPVETPLPVRIMVPMTPNTMPQFQPMYPMVYQPQTQPLMFPQLRIATPQPQENQVSNDEQMARELQATYDKEVNM